MLVLGFVVVRRVLASRPPAGYTLWRGLLLPDYFVLRSEEPSGSPDGSDAWGPGPCTRATFYHGLTDYSQAMQQMWGQWQRRGITLTRQNPRSAGYYYRKPSGGTVLVLWLPTGVGQRYTMTIWECPP